MDIEAVTHALGDHVRDAVVITEAEPIDRPGPRMVWVNKAFTDMTGFSAEEAIGQSPRILQGDDVDRAALKRIRTALKAWQPIREVLKNYTKSGEPFWVELDIKPVADTNGWYHYWIAVQRDVTERVQQAQDLRTARDEAETANRLKSEFLANMSHEIRTPMNGVLGMAQVLAMTDLDARQRRAVEAVVASGESLVGLIEDILDLSRVEAGRVVLAPEPISARALLDAAGQAVQGVCVQKGLELRIEAGADADTPFLADPKRMRQVLINLAGNAAKFTETGTVRLSAQRDQDHMVFEVSDTGPGVPAHQRDMIFDRFRQGDGSLSRQHEGTGLGLSIARDLAHLADGSIEVDDAPEGGARFRLRLPFKPANVGEGQTPTQDEPIIVKANRTALVVEDNAVNRQVVEEALSLHGWDVTCEPTAAPALERLQTEQYDLIIMDLEMPGMNGNDAIREIRKMPAPACRTPVLMLTAHAMDSTRASAAAAGADAFMAKPVDLDQLLKMTGLLAEHGG